MAMKNQVTAENAAGADVVVVRKIPFVELVELLEFNRLRFDTVGHSTQGPLLGVQAWSCGVVSEQDQHDGVYVCSTLGALQQAVLPPDDTELQIDVSSRNRIELRALEAGMLRSSSRPTCLRVDIQALINKVLVPSHAPAHLYEIVKHVVVSRLWVEVARV